MEREFNRLNVESSRSVLEFYQSRKNIGLSDFTPSGEVRAAPN
jgi:hypothetical protein